ncbi:putative effector of murein hydrolase [Evansella vedderi]|uniref:Effector of murein hydrolase n=1 Tax=Evansella vedderi TaxID=38282 RepID=A0ABU0A1Z1_9BACI|nr:putative effector of murein hydrolase [Evansella vedderi]
MCNYSHMLATILATSTESIYNLYTKGHQTIYKWLPKYIEMAIKVYTTYKQIHRLFFREVVRYKASMLIYSLSPIECCCCWR